MCGVGLWVLYRTTRFGFEVNVIADAPDAARYAGMRTRRKVLAVLGLSGAAAGLGGVADFGDVRHVLDPKGLSQVGYGYTGIVVAALARLNPIAVVFVSVLIGGLNNAGRSLQGPDFPAGLVGTLQGLILFFASAARCSPATASGGARSAVVTGVNNSLLVVTLASAVFYGTPIFYRRARRGVRRTLGRAQPRRRGHDAARRGHRAVHRSQRRAGRAGGC